MSTFGKKKNYKKRLEDKLNIKISLNINGEEIQANTSATETLLNFLRRIGYKDVKCGCEEGSCGSCLVLLDGKATNSCQVFAASCENSKVITSNGLGDTNDPHPIQKAFVDAGAVQCGFCTPGMVIATYELLTKNMQPNEEEIKEALSGNLCRCTGYVKIIEAVKLAADYMRNKKG
ncbi:MAG: (2Fe-2S)-binding protein [Exilispira sp.]|jgi:carbon-monoxide dehydrogenase small subunit|nr:(2Fe-2S)-binding protein [Exilispira sp.]